MASQPSSTVAESLGVLLQRRFRADLYPKLTRGLHPAVDAATYPVLSGIARSGPVSAAALGHQIGLDRSIVSRRSARLATAGLVRAAADPADARVSLLSLTGEGRRVVGCLRARLDDAIDAHLAGWTAEDQRRFADLLSRFVEPGSL